ncbi:MAG: 16S rRNA (cytosine(967)-C(5))-methyltransferase RsmB [Christensenellales bacterium]
MSDIQLSYDVLSNIFKNKAFSSIELSKKLGYANNAAWVTKLVYGVLERNVELEYYLSKMAKKRPQASVVIVLKMGMYCISYMDSMPNYAVVDNMVELTAFIGKKQLKGFVNSLLKNYAAEKPSLPENKVERLSVEASVPLWIINKYVKQYGYDKTREFLTCPALHEEHIRPNTRLISLTRLCKVCDDKGIKYRLSECGGMWVKNDKKLRDLFNEGLITIQSVNSMRCVQAMEIRRGDKVLDMCAAPGGKSLYIAEQAAGVEVVACDVHQHRVELMQSYISRMKADGISALQQDSTVIMPGFEKLFDKVLCDVPCSGLGVAKKKPDIYLNLDEQSIAQLNETQYKILQNACRYAKDDGKVIYSTCTLLREENYNIVGKFVKENPDWTVESYHQYLPDGDGSDGFFVAVLVHKQNNSATKESV